MYERIRKTLANSFFTYLKSRKIEEKNPMLRKFLLDQNNFERVPLSSPFFKRFFEVKRVEIPLFLGAKTKIRCFGKKKKGINSIIEDERKRMDKLTNRLAWKRKSGSSCCNSATICPRIIRLNRDDSRQRLSLPRITAPTRGSTRLSTLFTILKRRRFFFFFCTAAYTTQSLLSPRRTRREHNNAFNGIQGKSFFLFSVRQDFIEMKMLYVCFKLREKRDMLNNRFVTSCDTYNYEAIFNSLGKTWQIDHPILNNRIKFCRNGNFFFFLMFFFGCIG